MFYKCLSTRNASSTCQFSININQNLQIASSAPNLCFNANLVFAVLKSINALKFLRKHYACTTHKNVALSSDAFSYCIWKLKLDNQYLL